MITAMLSKFKVWFFAGIGIVMACLALWGKLMANKAEKYEQKAKKAEKKAEDATELSNQQSALSEAQQQAREKHNELIKERTNEQPDPGVDFNRNRVHEDRNKD